MRRYVHTESTTNQTHILFTRKNEVDVHIYIYKRNRSKEKQRKKRSIQGKMVSQNVISFHNMRRVVLCCCPGCLPSKVALYTNERRERDGGAGRSSPSCCCFLLHGKKERKREMKKRRKRSLVVELVLGLAEIEPLVAGVEGAPLCVLVVGGLVRVDADAAGGAPDRLAGDLADAVAGRGELDVVVEEGGADEAAAAAVEVGEVPPEGHVGLVGILVLQDAVFARHVPVSGVPLGDLEGGAVVPDVLDVRDAARRYHPGVAAAFARAAVVLAHVAAAARGAVDVNGRVAVVVDVEAECLDAAGQGGEEEGAGGGGMHLVFILEEKSEASKCSDACVF